MGSVGELRGQLTVRLTYLCDHFDLVKLFQIQWINSKIHNSKAEHKAAFVKVWRVLFCWKDSSDRDKTHILLTAYFIHFCRATVLTVNWLRVQSLWTFIQDNKVNKHQPYCEAILAFVQNSTHKVIHNTSLFDSISGKTLSLYESGFWLLSLHNICRN